MSPRVARPLLHTVHLLTFAILLGTGLLIFLPALREIVTGGYSLWIRAVHRWGGVAFVALPALVIARSGLRALAPERDGTAALRVLLRGAHVAVTVAMGLVLTVTGFVVWGKRTFSEEIVDASLSVHGWLTYAAMVLVALHLVETGATAVVARLAAASSSDG